MSNVTSLSLLKGAKAAELGEELEKPDAAPAVEAPAEETVSVDVDTMARRSSTPLSPNMASRCRKNGRRSTSRPSATG